MKKQNLDLFAFALHRVKETGKNFWVNEKIIRLIGTPEAGFFLFCS